MNENKLGKLIVELRKNKDLTQRQLGEILGVSNKTVSKWENGVTKPTVNTLYKLADYFGISVDELSDGATSEKASSEADTDIIPSTEKAKTQEKKPLFELSRKNVLRLAAVFLFIILISSAVFGAYYFRDAVKVPNVVGKNAEYASSKLEDLKLNIKLIFKHSSTVDENVVISQSTSSGMILKPNSCITLTVSLGAEKVRVPYIEGRTLEEAEKILRELELDIDYVEEFSYSVGKGKVVRQIELPNSAVPKGYTVRAVVSLGQDFTQVPSVVGLTRDEAVKLLTENGFGVETDIRNGDNYQSGLVMSQSIAPNETVARGCKISIIICSDEPINVQGNTSSNLAMLGNVSSQGDWVYYSNINVDGYLYRMRNDGSDRQLLTKGIITQINVIGEWIYYYDSYGVTRGIYKIKTDGTCKTQIFHLSVSWMMVIDDIIYYVPYSDGDTLCKMKTDGTEITELLDSNVQTPSISIIGDWIYYINKSSSRPYKLRTDGTGHQKVSQAINSAISVFGEGQYVFLEHSEGFYRLNTLTDELINFKSQGQAAKQTYNYCGGKIYYSESEYYGVKDEYSNNICVMEENGENCKTVAFIRIGSNMSVTNGWIYFMNYYDNSYLYRIRTDGTDLQHLYK